MASKIRGRLSNFLLITLIFTASGLHLVITEPENFHSLPFKLIVQWQQNLVYIVK
jgi:hypothetical protein